LLQNLWNFACIFKEKNATLLAAQIKEREERKMGLLKDELRICFFKREISNKV
jgi:hypothetical protein